MAPLVVAALLPVAWSVRALGQTPETDDQVDAPIAPPEDSEEATAGSTEDGPSVDGEAATVEPESLDALAPPPPGSTQPSRRRAIQLTDVTNAELGRATDPFWSFYQDAALALADGERERATELLRRVCRLAPEHPAAIEAQRLLDRMGQHVEATARSGEARSNLARAELATRQTLQGGAVGVLFCAALDCADVRPWTLSILLGASAGLGLTLGLTRGGVSPGQAVLYTTVPRWGYLNGFLLFTALGVNVREDEAGYTDWRLRTSTIGFLLSHAAALGAAAAVDRTLAPRGGDVAIMDTFMMAASGLLTSIYVVGGGFRGVGEHPGRLRGLMGGLLAANALALTGAGLLTRRVEFSRTRSLLIDLGMAAGFGLGVGSAALVQGEDFNPNFAFGLAALGLAAGFGLSYWLTRNVGHNDDELAVEVSMSPTFGGAKASVHTTF